MQIIERKQGQTVLLDLSGRLEASSAPQFVAWLQKLPAGPTRLAVNLSGVTFIDSTGLSALVQGMKRCRERSGEFVLFGLQQPVRIIFELTRLDKAFNIFLNEQDAMDALAIEKP